MNRRLSFATQALLLHLGVLLLVLLAGFSLVGVLLRSELESQFEQRALAIARSVAADPSYAVDVVARAPSVDGDVQRRAEAVRRRANALFVVVTDGRGVRYSHPNPELVGQVVSTDPSEALAGNEVVALQRGTLGLSARGKVPFRDSTGTVVGEVSVGIDAQSIRERLLVLLRGTAGFGLVALLLGAAGVFALVRRLKRQTLGLEPAELTDLVREHEAVLHGVQDGVLAVDSDGRVSIVNDAARALLGNDVVAGADVDVVLPPRLRGIVRRGDPVDGKLVLAGDRVLVVKGQAVVRHGRDLGMVLTVRDRTDLEDLGRELDSVRALFDALRAQSHEYTNRLHTVAGLLQLGHTEQALDYVAELSVDPLTAADAGGPVRDPYLQGLLAAKRAAASERGVQLGLSEDSQLNAVLTSPLDVVTVLGNLIDNAIRAAASGVRRPAWVEVALAGDGSTLHLAVTDSGDGVAERDAPLLFDDGWTTTTDDGRPHGIGLALVRQTARRHRGDVRLVALSGPDHGAVVSADLHHVLVLRDAGLVGEPST